MKCLRCGVTEQSCPCYPREKSANRYQPWVTEGITEVEYWKWRYLDERKSACAAVRDLRRYVTKIEVNKVHIALPGFQEDENGVYHECAVLDLPVMAKFLEDNE